MLSDFVPVGIRHGFPEPSLKKDGIVFASVVLHSSYPTTGTATFKQEGL